MNRPWYTTVVTVVSVLAICLLTLAASVAIANANAKQQLARYEADKVATQEANRVLYCKVFGSQLDAFAEATSPAGRESYAAWLDVYKLARCQPARR